MQRLAAEVHAQDVRRPVGNYTDAGRQYIQWPVICAADIITVATRERSKRVCTLDTCEVTCYDCLNRIKAGK